MISNVRRALLATSFAAFVVVLSVAVAGPASASTPESWPDNESVNLIEAILLLAGVPVLVFVLITAITLAPGLARGEPMPGAAEADDQWIGGPRKAAGELAGPDGEGSQSGGAGGTW